MIEFVPYEDIALKRAYRKGRTDGLSIAVRYLIRIAFRCGDERKGLRAPEIFHIARLLQEEANR